MKFEVLTTQWGAEDDVFQGGVHELGAGECPCGLSHGKPTVAFLKLLAGAEAAGAVVVHEASEQHRARLDKAVQSQEDGEAAYAQAQNVYDPATGEIVKQGRWHHGNLQQTILDRQARIAALDVMVEEASTEASRQRIRDQRAVAVADLDQTAAAFADAEVPE